MTVLSYYTNLVHSYYEGLMNKCVSIRDHAITKSDTKWYHCILYLGLPSDIELKSKYTHKM
jgi:hypothetical protein